MTTDNWSNNRKIVERVVVTGELVLETPARFGNGDAEGATDMPLLLDPLEGRALLTGASIAGALRNHLWEREHGYGVRFDASKRGHSDCLAVQLFGGGKGDPDGLQSPLIVADALGEAPHVELRDGVRIDPETRTAADEAKFDFELLQAGTRFPLRFELLVTKGRGAELRKALALALQGLQRTGSQPTDIFLGARKRRGFGQCRVDTWTVQTYDLTFAKGAGLLRWLNDDPTGGVSGVDSATVLEQTQAVAAFQDARRRFRIMGSFWLDGSLLIRSGFGAVDVGPDAMHLHRPHVDSPDRLPILPGTSLAGAIRQRALRIAQTVRGSEGAAMVDLLFGRGPRDSEDRGHAGSRVEVRETVIKNVHSLVQNRIRIDRFTGGVLDNYLFNEAPVFGGPSSVISIDVIVRNPSDAEVGLLLLVLKDLWTADLPIGGGANVGRGRLHGLTAELDDGQMHWTLVQQWQGRKKGALSITGDRPGEDARVTLNAKVAALNGKEAAK